jgi:hypothetical protein
MLPGSVVCLRSGVIAVRTKALGKFELIGLWTADALLLFFRPVVDRVALIYLPLDD